MRTLRIALIDGPTYAPLYDVIPAFSERTGISVDIAACLPHAGLNDLLATEIDTFDLVSTHIKYAPSQANHLLPLDDILGSDQISPFLDGPLSQSRIDGALLQLPRHTDTRLLVYRQDWFTAQDAQERFRGRFGYPLAPPQTWNELLDIAVFFTTTTQFGFAFCGQPSGLFGAFFELLSSAGGTLVTEDGRVDLVSDAAHWALGYLRDLHVNHRVTPPSTLDWDFGDVTEAFMRGEIAMIGDWPGSFGLLRDPHRSRVADAIGIAPYPIGPAGLRRVYSGSHSFAITRTCRDIEAARDLLLTLTSHDAQLIEGRHGAIPTRRDVSELLRDETNTSFERQRLDLLSETVATAMVSFPSLTTYPRIEEIAWPMLSAALHNQMSVTDALNQAQHTIDADPEITAELHQGRH